MSDGLMTPSEELRTMLDERGIEYREYHLNPFEETTAWDLDVSDIRHEVCASFEEFDSGSTLLRFWNCTPEQAVEATLAPEKPEITEDGIDRWLRDFQREHDELRHIGTAELLDLAYALHDDIPLGYEASMRLANWLMCAVSGDVRRGDASDVAEGQREEANEHDGTA